MVPECWPVLHGLESAFGLPAPSAVSSFRVYLLRAEQAGTVTLNLEKIPEKSRAIWSGSLRIDRRAEAWQSL
jgi:hypothetical protein